MNVIVDEKEEIKLSKEEKLLLALNEVNNFKLFQKVKFLYKKGLYSKEVVDNFDEESYIEISEKNIKGYSVLANEEGELFMVKALDADSETDVYGYEVLSLSNVTEEELKLLKDYKKPVCIVKIVLVSLNVLFLLLALFGFLSSLFDNLKTGEEVDFANALNSAFFIYGASVPVGLAALLLFFKGNKKCCKK